MPDLAPRPAGVVIRPRHVWHLWIPIWIPKIDNLGVFPGNVYGLSPLDFFQQVKLDYLWLHQLIGQL
jgi:hypothetical protein